MRSLVAILAFVLLVSLCGSTTIINFEQLRCLAPGAASSEWVDTINQVMQKYEINTPERVQMFLSQIAYAIKTLEEAVEVPDCTQNEGCPYLSLLAQTFVVAAPSSAFEIAGLQWQLNDMNACTDEGFEACLQKLSLLETDVTQLMTQYELARNCLGEAEFMTISMKRDVEQVGSACSVPGVGAGKCLDSGKTQCTGGKFHTGRCPGNAKIKCCVSSSATPARPNPPPSPRPASGGSTIICSNPSRFKGQSLCHRGIYCGECVSFVKVCTGDNRVTGEWIKGRQVRGANLPFGTSIATFPNGKYYGHAAIYTGQNAEGIQVWDQWKGHPVSTRTIRWTGSGISNNGNSFFVIEGRPRFNAEADLSASFSDLAASDALASSSTSPAEQNSVPLLVGVVVIAAVALVIMIVILVKFFNKNVVEETEERV